MLEKALEENTAAIKALTAAMGSQDGATAQKAPAKTATKKAPATATAKKAPAATIKSVSDLVLTLVDLKQRPVVVSLLKKLGATKVKDVPKAKLPVLQKQFLAVVAKVKAAAAEEVEEEIPEEDFDFDEAEEGLEEEEVEEEADDLDFLDDI